MAWIAVIAHKCWVGSHEYNHFLMVDREAVESFVLVKDIKSLECRKVKMEKKSGVGAVCLF